MERNSSHPGLTGMGVKEARSDRLATADADCLRCLTGISSATPGVLLGAETEDASVRLLAGPLLTIRSKRNSAALSRGFRSVASGGLVAALPLSLSATPKRKP